MDIRQHLTDRLRRDRDAFLQLVQDLVRIPSENPPGDTTRIFAYVTDWLAKRGLPHATVAPQPTMPNLVGSFDGGEPGKHLVLNGHIDVFPAGDASRWQDDPFSGAVRDGKVFGRGVTDMKVGTAASMVTYAYLHEIKDHLKGRLTLTAVSDEETFGPWGARWLIEHRPDVLGDCVLNGEPSTPQTIRFGEKGIIWLELTLATKGGHGAYAQVSDNAIKQAGAIIAELEELTQIEPEMPAQVEMRIENARVALDAALGPGATDTLKQVTVNIGVIEGGYKVNMIPGHCRVEVDVRCPVGVPLEVALARFDAIVSRHPNASYRVINQSAPNWVDPNHPMLTILQNNAVAVRNIKPLPILSIGGTDCRLWRLKGIPAFIYGPNPYNMGAPDEYATLDDLFGTYHVHVLSAYDYLMSSAG